MAAACAWVACVMHALMVVGVPFPSHDYSEAPSTFSASFSPAFTIANFGACAVIGM